MSGSKSEQGLFDAAIESAKIFNQTVSQCAVSGHLVNALDDYSTVNTVMDRMQFHPSKQPAVEALLKVLVDTDLAEERIIDGQMIYRAKVESIQEKRDINGGLQRYQPQFDVLTPWFGEKHANLIHASNTTLVGEDLSFFRTPAVKIRFERSFIDSWRTNLSNPLYEYGRIVAVAALVKRGNRFLDLACGLGYGAQRLAEYSPSGCRIVGIDNARDMLDQARMIIYPGAKVQFIERDLNTGLPPFPANAFDGVLFNGSFHFIQDKRARLQEIHSVLRPGGLLVIGHCFCRSNFVDEPMHQLYFSMLDNPIWLISFSSLQSLLRETGFLELHQYHRGSHSYILAERLPDNDIMPEEITPV